MIKDIHIQNYCGITDLKINNCKRINLLVGKNGVGKEEILRFVFDIDKVSFRCFSEIEYGLHYTDMKDFWLNMIESSIKNNVQIFVTTHSYEMIEALIEAAKETNLIEQDEIRVFKIAKKGNETLIGSYNAEEIESKIEARLEIR
jgi:AAA15 family ATPase/GTPase